MRIFRDITDPVLERQHAAVLAALPIPMAPACVRSLRKAGAREHIYAESHRKSGAAQGTTPRNVRRSRLTRAGLRAEARACDLAREAR